MLLLLSSMALGGYGDAIDSYPWYEERDIFLWTNAARVDPEAFEDAYNAGGCSVDDFSDDERTPKAPVQTNYLLNQTARSHSIDMYDNDFFDHTGSDGSSPSDRAASFGYTNGVSENIATGYSDGWDVVMHGWMCSTTGHRENIMTAGWDELGTGVKGAKMTQNFGTGGVGRRAVSMGIHAPEKPLGSVEFLADCYVEGGPDELIVVYDGQPFDMDLLYGEAGQGIYQVELDIDSDGCHQYFFQVDVAGEYVRYPEEGSYGWGDCEWDDPDSEWLASQMGIAGRDHLTEDELRERFRLVGCSTAGGLGLGWVVLLPLLGLRRRP